jgi:hypothetical protein
MSCGAPTAQAWEPQSSSSSAWTTRQRTTLDWQKPCERPAYYYTDAAPQGWSYYLPHKDPLQQPNAYYRFPFYGANAIYRAEGNFYSEPKGACVSNDQCIDNMTSSSCLYKPFYAGAKCAQLGEMGYQATTDRNFAQNTEPQRSEFAPWANLKQTYDTLLENWQYNRPGYNETPLNT